MRDRNFLTIKNITKSFFRDNKNNEMNCKNVKKQSKKLFCNKLERKMKIYKNIVFLNFLNFLLRKKRNR